ncbi:MAG: flagellar basal body P-ring formation chaperone FlgA [Beijerinckiaceae bacterium]
MMKNGLTGGARAGAFVFAGLAVLLCATTGALATQRLLLVPNTTLYPRDVIRQEHLAPREFVYDPDGRSMYVENPEEAIGLAARTTLPANRPIPLSALEKPRLVVIGATVNIRYSEGGINIITRGVALQSGSEGDPVKVRNGESGVTIAGVVEADGAVRVVEP